MILMFINMPVNLPGRPGTGAERSSQVAATAVANSALALLALAVMFAPYLGSVISNVGRRPVVLRARARTAPRRGAVTVRRSPAH